MIDFSFMHLKDDEGHKYVLSHGNLSQNPPAKFTTPQNNLTTQTLGFHRPQPPTIKRNLSSRGSVLLTSRAGSHLHQETQGGMMFRTPPADPAVNGQLGSTVVTKRPPRNKKRRSSDHVTE